MGDAKEKIIYACSLTSRLGGMEFKGRSLNDTESKWVQGDEGWLSEGQQRKVA